MYVDRIERRDVGLGMGRMGGEEGRGVKVLNLYPFEPERKEEEEREKKEKKKFTYMHHKSYFHSYLTPKLDLTGKMLGPEHQYRPLMCRL